MFSNDDCGYFGCSLRISFSVLSSVLLLCMVDPVRHCDQFAYKKEAGCSFFFNFNAYAVSRGVFTHPPWFVGGLMSVIEPLGKLALLRIFINITICERWQFS